MPSPFNNMYETIDSTLYSNVWWQSFSICYNLHNDLPVMKVLLLDKQQNMIVGSVILGKSFTIFLPMGDSIRNLTMYTLPRVWFQWPACFMMSFLEIGVGAKQSVCWPSCARLLFDILIYFVLDTDCMLYWCFSMFTWWTDSHIDLLRIDFYLYNFCILEDVVHTWHHISKVT